MAIEAQSSAKRRGRPRTVSRVYSLAEVADMLRFPVEALTRLLEVAPGVIPGASRDGAGAWQVTGEALGQMLHPLPLEQMVTVQDIAQAWRIPSVHTVYGWLRLKGPNGERLLRSEKRLGRTLIPARAVLSLPERMPAWAAPFFFLRRDKEEP